MQDEGSAVSEGVSEDSRPFVEAEVVV